MGELVKAFRALSKMPVAIWFVIWAFSVDAMAYFGILTVMKPYIHNDIGLSDAWSTLPVSIFTGAITACWMAFGGIAERLGVRKGMILALSIGLTGRVFYGAAVFFGYGMRLSVLMIALLIVAVAEGMVQSAAYAGIKQYTDEDTNSMGYAMLYAIMNLGIVVAAEISNRVRVPFDAAFKAGETKWSGIAHVNWAFAGVTMVCLLVYLLFLTPAREAQMIRPPAQADADAPKKPAMDRLVEFFVGTKEAPSPFRDVRFIFFIFMLLPVRTLFAHQWLTMPDYILRAYDKDVADNMERLVNWINPAIIFFGVPTITAMTKKYNVYTMMILGTAVSAIPTFLLCTGPNLGILIGYMVLFSIGEALWSARFLEYAAELAPEGRLSQYMGLANIPWLLAKSTTGLYAGYMLGRYCPETGPKDTSTMWLIYGLIALSTPVGLIIARRWVMVGLKTKASRPAAEAA
jgi:MFS family permease